MGDSRLKYRKFKASDTFECFPHATQTPWAM